MSQSLLNEVTIPNIEKSRSHLYLKQSQSLLNEVTIPTDNLRSKIAHDNVRSQSLLNEVTIPTIDCIENYQREIKVAIPFK